MTPAEVEAKLRERVPVTVDWIASLMLDAADAIAAQALELERMRELVASLEQRANTCLVMARQSNHHGDEDDAARLIGKASAYAHAADLARQALKAG